MKWLISVPVWGERYNNLFVARTLPAIRAANNVIGGQVRFVIHTDDPDLLHRHLGAFRHDLFPVPEGKTPHHSAGLANREALKIAEPAECVAFINADMVPSVEVFAAAERRFSLGKRLVMMAATRTDAPAPIGKTARELLAWTMQHRHASVRDCFWGPGMSRVPWAIYFQRGDAIVLHAFHLHPFAVFVDRDLRFDGVTIDRDLADAFSTDEIHVVTDTDEAAFAEMSPPDRVFPRGKTPMTIATVAEWAGRQATSPRHLWFFEQQITIAGNGEKDFSAAGVCAEILNAVRCSQSATTSPSARRPSMR